MTVPPRRGPTTHRGEAASCSASRERADTDAGRRDRGSRSGGPLRRAPITGRLCRNPTRGHRRLAMRHGITAHVRRNIVLYLALIATLGGTSYAAAAVTARTVPGVSATRPGDDRNVGNGDRNGGADRNGDNGGNGGNGDGNGGDDRNGDNGGNGGNGDRNGGHDRNGDNG